MANFSGTPAGRPVRLSLWQAVATAVACSFVALSVCAQPGTASTTPFWDGKTQQYYFDTYGVESDLPGKAVFNVLQTSDGYVWVGTESGLARFDGVRFISFRPPTIPALDRHVIHALFEDREGYLWVGTNEGVVRYHNGVFELIGLKDTAVHSFAQDKVGRIWIGTGTQGLYRWQGGTLTNVSREAGLPALSVQDLFVDSSDRLWILMNKGNGIVRYENGTFSRYTERRITRDVLTMCEWPQGTLWLGTSGSGLYRLKGETVTQYLPPDGLNSDSVTDVRPAKDGTLWVTAHGLQSVADPEQVRFTTVQHLPTQHIKQLCEDHEGNTWIVAYGEGLIRMRRTPFQSITTNDGLPGNQVNTVTEDQDRNLWFVLSGYHLTRIGHDGSVTSFSGQGLPSAPSGAFAASDGTLWVASGKDLFSFRNGRWSSTAADSAILGMYEDHAGTLWVSTDPTGLWRWQAGKLQPVVTSPHQPIPLATSFGETRDGTMFVGTWRSGVYAIKDGRLTVFDKTVGLPSNEIRAVYADQEDNIWVGTRNAGLAVKSGERWYFAREFSEAVGGSVSAINEDEKGNLWVGSIIGVTWTAKNALLASARGQGPKPEIYFAGMGNGFRTVSVPSGPQPVVWKTHDRALLFATYGGVLAIDPERLPGKNPPPPVHIEKVALDGRPVSAFAPVNVAAGVREIAIEYTALSFTEPNRLRFKYKLEGYDQDWVDAETRRTVSYINLPPGEYTFRVKACNSDGVWNESGAKIEITQQPLFYQTLWFAGLAIASLAGLAFGLYRWRTAALRWENERLEKGIAEHTRDLAQANSAIAERTYELELANTALSHRTRELELANTAKSEFLEGISHEIRNPLNGLNGLLDLLQRETMHPSARELTKSIYACAKSLTRNFDEVLSFSELEYRGVAPQPTPFLLLKLLNEVIASFAWQANQQANELRLEVAPNFVDGFEGDENKIKTIISNFVSNAIKYAPGSLIELRADENLTEEDTIEVCIEVCDHGPGIPLEEQELIFRKFVRGSNARNNNIAGTGLGLAMCSVLARSLDGNVRVDSQAGRGSTFYLSVPLRRAAAPILPPATLAEPGSTALVVDDDQFCQIVLKDIVTQLGYETHIASNAEQAEAAAAQRLFTVVLLDWELPDKKGGDVARRIRASPGGEKPTIIATTAHDSSEIRQKCREAGMDDFLLKPYDIDQVRHRISNARAKRDGRVSIAPTDWESRPASSPAKGLNLQAFRHYAAGSGQPIEAAAQRYREALGEELAKLDVAIKSNDRRLLADGAHRLNALGGLIAAGSLMQAAKQLSAAAQQDSSAEQIAAFQFVVAAVERLEQDIAKAKTATTE
jgi:signal transduction histidine kinase/ligand-binding sensor domain-containing protein/DNA-binding response OmpR family regulator